MAFVCIRVYAEEAHLKKLLDLVKTNLGAPLFWMAGTFTLIYWAMISVQFVFGANAVHVPAALGDLYNTILGSYVGVNLLEKAANNGNGNGNGNGKKRRGELFFCGWLILAAVIVVLSAFGIYGDAEAMKLFWPTPLIFVITIFGGSQALKNTGKLVLAAKGIWKSAGATETPKV